NARDYWFRYDKSTYVVIYSATLNSTEAVPVSEERFSVKLRLSDLDKRYVSLYLYNEDGSYETLMNGVAASSLLDDNTGEYIISCDTIERMELDRQLVLIVSKTANPDDSWIYIRNGNQGDDYRDRMIILVPRKGGPIGSATRIYGSTRYKTSIQIADTFKEVRGVDKFEAIVLVDGRDFPDGLSASYLAAAKKAPILTTDGSKKSRYETTNT
ncbi:MAG: cell wall-binding repeat-containing protein, partial [Lachnospiraceae bacterium]|nr:cell wall-binding repeat-containing protein [Lachnospiraceae bacterium]